MHINASTKSRSLATHDRNTTYMLVVYHKFSEADLQQTYVTKIWTVSRVLLNHVNQLQYLSVRIWVSSK